MTLDLSKYRLQPDQQPQPEVSSLSQPPPLDLSQFRIQPDQQAIQPPKQKMSGDQIASKGQRLVTQGMIGALQGAALPYDLAAIGSRELAKGIAPMEQRQNLFSEIEDLQEQKARGEWNPESQARYDEVVDLIKNPRKAEKFLPKSEEIPHYDVGSIIEGAAKQAGVDLTPKGAEEMALRWIGLIKNPASFAKVLEGNPKSILQMARQLAPTGKEAIRGAGAGIALQAAAQSQFGPMGTIASAIIGDSLPQLAVGAVNIAKDPRKAIATLASLPAKIGRTIEQRQLQKEIIQAFREAGIQADIGTITGSNLVKGFQTMLEQSQFTGEALTTFKQEMLKNITDQYKQVADQLGQARFANAAELGESLSQAAKVQDTYLARYEKPKGYQPRSLVGRVSAEAEPQLGASQQQLLHEIAPQPFVSDAQAGHALASEAQAIERARKAEFAPRFSNLSEKVGAIESAPQPALAGELSALVDELSGSLLEGASPAEAKLLRESRRLLGQVTVGGDAQQLRGTNLSNLVKTKKTLGDIPNWELRGTRSEEMFKRIYGMVDSAIEDTLRSKNPQLLEEYINLNREYSQFKNTFENSSVAPLFRRRNVKPRSLYKHSLKADNVEAIDRILSQSESGQQTLAQLKRDFAQSQMKGQAQTAREIENLRSVLGNQFDQSLDAYAQSQARLGERAGQMPRAVRPSTTKQVASPFRAWFPSRQLLPGRVTEAHVGKAKKFFEKIQGKTPEQVAKLASSVDGLREIREILSKTQEGRDLYNAIARYKLDEIFGANLKIGVDNQLKMGTFSKVLNNRSSRDMIREIVGPEAFQKLQKIEERTVQLQESAQKFFNASKSGTRSADMIIAATIASDIARLFMGNPWPLVRSTGGIAASRYLSSLMADPTFLRLVEDIILVPAKGGSAMQRAATALVSRARELGYPAAIQSAQREKPSGS